jgi:hypothetical protein
MGAGKDREVVIFSVGFFGQGLYFGIMQKNQTHFINFPTKGNYFNILMFFLKMILLNTGSSK